MRHARQDVAVNDDATVQERVARKFKAQPGKHRVALRVRGQAEAGHGREAEVVPPVVEDGEGGFRSVALAAV